ncbi:MAG: hypothetical protein ACYDB2_10720 [Acidimicrobiales bacterium]
MNRRSLIVPALVGGSLLLSACGSSTTTTTSLATMTTTTSVPASTSRPTRDLIVTPTVRTSLLDAAAAYHQLPAQDYVGLDTGTTYYAFDPVTNQYYAAAGLRPNPHSLAAQIGTQDDGAYNLFVRAAGTGTWTVYDDGLGGVRGTKCPVVIPSAVLHVWNWRAHSCYPPT